MRKALEFLGEACELQGYELFPRPVLQALQRLFPGSGVTYDEFDYELRQHTLFKATGEYRAYDSELTAAAARAGYDMPFRTYARLRKTVKLSDLITSRKLHNLACYTDWLAHAGVEDILVTKLPSPPTQKHWLLVYRDTDYTRRDVELLELLRPHLARIYDDTIRRRQAAAALAALGAEDTEMIVLSTEGRIELITASASQRLRHRPDLMQGALIPSPLLTTLREQGQVTLDDRGQDLTLRILQPQNGLTCVSVRQANHRNGVARLTPREREVLGHVAQGMTNGEIAGTLFLAPSTVRKHLEHAYAKLGVRTRTAAVSKIFLDY